MVTVKQDNDCYVCCKNLDAIDTSFYASNHLLKFTKMTLAKCLEKALSLSLSKYRKDLPDLWLCLECNEIIGDLDHFLHQYTETQAKLRLRFNEAHSQDQCNAKLERFKGPEMERDLYGDESGDAEIRFLRKLSDRSSLKRVVRSNPRYADGPPPRPQPKVCSVCNQEHSSEAALEAHMEGAHDRRCKRGRGRPRKHVERGSVNTPMERESEDYLSPIKECKTVENVASLKEDRNVPERLQNCPVVDGTISCKTGLPSFDRNGQGSKGKAVSASENEPQNIEQKCAILAVEVENDDSNIHVDLVLDVDLGDCSLSSDCDKFVKRESLRRHPSSNAKEEKQVKQSRNKKYMQREKCPKCGKIFIGRTKLRKHMLLHSDSWEQKICEVCGRVLHNATAHKVHLQRLHNIALDSPASGIFQMVGDKKKASCHICGKTYRGASGLSYHLAAKHNKGPRYPCDKCTRVFPHSRNLSSHKAQAHGSYSLICEHCGETFKLQTQLNSHINSIHRGITSWTCHLCPSKFSSHIDHRIHVNKHKRLTYACDVCGKRYSWREALKKHKRMKHECYESSASHDCSTATSSLTSEVNPPAEEKNDDAAVLPRPNLDVPVEEVEIGPILRSEMSHARNENNSASVNATLSPIILGTHIDQKGARASSLALGRSSGPAEKVMDFGLVVPVASKTNRSYDEAPDIDDGGLPPVMSNGRNAVEREPLSNSAMRSVAPETCDGIFLHGEPHGITGGHVEEVVIVQTDSSVNYDYIVYHVSS